MDISPHRDGRRTSSSHPADRITRGVLRLVAAGALAGAPVMTTAYWLLITDPALAGEVAASGSISPVARALIGVLGRAFAALLALL